MKHISVPLFGLCLCLPVFSQEEETVNKTDSFQFTTVKAIPVTPVKNQSASGTCWSFSGTGLIEAELLRMGKGEFDLSEMFVVHHNYSEKAQKYVRMHGTVNFAGGGSFADVLDCIGDHGIVPDSAMPGLNYGDTLHQHGELDRLLKAYVDVIINNPNKKLSTAWYRGLKGILNAYLGRCPETFTCNGKSYTPQSFARFLGIHPEDYVSITSFTHHPFYTSFALEIPDNWRWAKSYNLPLDEMMQTVDHAIDSGYTVAWASDVSEKGYSRKGFAVVPDEDSISGWSAFTKEEKDEYFKKLSAPVPEKKITQEMRQEGFDGYETGDDHGMLIYGKAQDRNGSNYYIVKNSWGQTGSYKGIWYASTPFVEYKTVSIVLHKDALPKSIKNKLGLK